MERNGYEIVERIQFQLSVWRGTVCVYKFDRQGFKGDRRWIISCLHSIITLLVNTYRFYNINTKAHAITMYTYVGLDISGNLSGAGAKDSAQVSIICFTNIKLWFNSFISYDKCI